MMTTGLILAPRNPNTGLLDPDYYPNSPINPDNSWSLASAFLPTTPALPLQMVSFSPSSGADAYHLWASTHFGYRAKVGFIGGYPPYRITLLDYPNGAILGTGSVIQNFVSTLDATVALMYNRTVPTHYAEINWQPVTGDIGSSFMFRLSVESADRQVVYITYYVTVDNTKFIFVDGTAPNDSGPGTWASPKKTFDAAHNNPGKICAYKTAGTYAVTFGGLNNSDNRVRSHIALVPGVVFDMSAQQFGCGTAADDLAFIGIEFNGSVVANTNCRVFNLSGRVSRAVWWGCKWRNVRLGTNAGSNPACIALMSLGHPPGTDGDGRGPYLNLPALYTHTDIIISECDTDSTVDSQLAVIFSATGILAEQNTANYPTTPVLVGGISNGGQWIHFKDSCRNATARFNLCTQGGFVLGPIIFSNQRGFYCDSQEMLHNVIVWNQGVGAAFNRQTLVAGDAAQGQRNAPTNTRCIKNTFMSTTSGVLEFLRWLAEATDANRTTLEGNLSVTTASNILSDTTIADNGAALVGQNLKMLASDFDASRNLTGAARTANLGVNGAEISSTLVP